jgi:hypothetical protein
MAVLAAWGESAVDNVSASILWLSTPSTQPRELTDEIVRPGWLGFAVFLALVAACYLLFRSMRHQLSKVDFDEDDPGNGRTKTAPPDDDPATPPS